MSGLTPQGFLVKRLQEILAELDAALREEFGAEIVTGPESAFGRMLGIIAKPIAELWELAQATHSTQYPATADGASLDNVLDLNGLRRLAAESSRAWQAIIGNPSTLVPANSLVSHATSLARFLTSEDVTLDLTDRVLSIFVEVSGEPHGVGETYSVTVDGVTESFVTVGGESDLDVAIALRNAIDPGFSITDVDQTLHTFTISGNHTDRFGLVGRRLRVAGASGSPSNNGQYTIVSATFSGGDTIVEVAQDIPSPTVSGDLRWNCEALAGTVGSVTTLALRCLAEAPPFLPVAASDAGDFAMAISLSASIPANFTLATVARPVLVAAVDTGPIEAEAGAINVIETPVSGWTSTLNVLPADVGRNIETDAEARARRARTVAIGGTATVEAILAALLQTRNVDDANVFENVTDVTDADGRPPHSIECVVTGGLDDEIAESIFLSKAAGIATHGNTVQVVVDSQGFSHAIRFSRPVDVPIFVEVTADALYAEEDLPPFPADAVKQAVEDAGATFRAGLDVLPERLKGPIFVAVPGLAALTVKVGLAAPPAVSTTPIPISASEIARFDVARVTVVGL